jgi:hypothetical protein
MHELFSNQSFYKDCHIFSIYAPTPKAGAKKIGSRLSKRKSPNNNLFP